MLEDFKQFLKEYRQTWNGQDAVKMAAHHSERLEVRWANDDASVSDWGFDGTEQGWVQAYLQYEGRNPTWTFQDIMIDINNQHEGVAVFWVHFEVDGEMTDVKLLFVETFRKELGEWKKIREYVENGFPV
ncbi:hypothetical protein LCM10_05130 [Rossellomorea aquimaris]|uniref:hypothetical protein n=1 Tax=Rossellomorea aquimaris TaxID=189382 RepID=UPI001CD55B2A|nr:hypothetical protein [Rossellomorea aquimaris]MCA1054361.1 hypothetical protein [Rossellomorea aquimaris]